MEEVLVLSEEEVKKHLSWEGLVPAVEQALVDYSRQDGSVIQPARTIMPVPHGALLSMPGYWRAGNSLGCKLVTSFPENKLKGKPSILAQILLFDGRTGDLKLMMGGTEITGWRTAAASVVATKHLHRGEKGVLAVLGGGVQARSHIAALMHQFNFKQVRVWTRRKEQAEALCLELGGGPLYQPVEQARDCVAQADVIVTATYADSPILCLDWLKNANVHINAVGAGLTHHSEVDLATYKEAAVVTDSLQTAAKELAGLQEAGVPIWGEIGHLISTCSRPTNRITIFQSLGMAIEDIVSAKLVYDEYLKEKHKKDSLMYTQV